MILESPTNPAHDYWLLVDPGETVGVRTIGAFLSFLVSPRCHGAALGTRSTQEKYCVLTLQGPMDDAGGRHARLTYRLTAEEVHALLSAEEKGMLVAALERVWGKPSDAGHPPPDSGVGARSAAGCLGGWVIGATGMARLADVPDRARRNDTDGRAAGCWEKRKG